MNSLNYLAPSGELGPSEPMDGPTIRVLAFVEASWLTGPAKNLIELARRANEQPCDSRSANIAIATFQRDGLEEPNRFVIACEQAGVNVHVIRERFRFDPGVVPAIRKLITEYGPDILQTHSVKSHFLVRASGVNKQCRWIAFHHGYTWTSVRARLYNYLDRLSLPSADQVVTVCQPFATALAGIGVPAERIAIQHNSVNPYLHATEDEILALRQSFGLPMGIRILLSVGRLSKEKGHLDLIDALGRLKKENRELNLRLVIVGAGPERKRIQRAARRHAVEDLVVFAGQQSGIAPFYSVADIMVLPSHTEGSPNTLLEAMAAGVPTVATAVGGVPEIVTNEKTALLVERSNPGALAQAISRFLHDEMLRLKIGAAAQEASLRFSPEAHCRALLTIYDRVYARGLRPAMPPETADSDCHGMCGTGD